MPRSDIECAIRAGADAMALALPDDAHARLAHLLAELARWNARINLTAIRDPHAMVAGHVLDSLAVRALLHGGRIADVGTGAGFPGLPLAIAEPERDITLIDSNGKKISFVRHMIGELGLGNAVAVQARVEHYAPGSPFDTVIARAFAPLPRMIGLTEHLIDDTGVLLALKGRYPAAELADLATCTRPWECDVTELTVPALEQHARHAISLRRTRETRS